MLLKKSIARGDYATIESNGAPIRRGLQGDALELAPRR
jgi:hypothetical protein